MSEPISEDAKAALREMGITEYEMRAYLYLLRTGLSTASRISNDAHIPYSKMYEVLNSLERKGWIRSQEGRPRLYYPRSPREALEETKVRIDNRVKSWQKFLFSELQPIYERRGIREKPDIWIFYGEPIAVAKLKEMLNNAKEEVLMAVPRMAYQLVGAILPTLKGLGNSNLKVLIMLSGGKDEFYADLDKLGEVRFKDEMFGGGVIVDGCEVLLILGELKPSIMLWSNHLDLVKFAKNYFHYLWNTAYKS